MRVRTRQMVGQAMVEFGLTVGMLMLVVVFTAQLAVYLHYRSDLQTAAQEGAFQASLVGHTTADGQRTAQDLWSGLEPNGGSIQVDIHQSGNLIVVTADGTAPAFLPVPGPSYRALPIHVQTDHSIERFQPGS